MGEGNLPSPLLKINSSLFSSSVDAGHGSIVNASSVPSCTPVHGPSLSDKGLQKLSSNIEGLLSLNQGDAFSDVLFEVSGQQVGLHQCILAARSPFFRTLFSKTLVELSSFAPNHAKCREDSARLIIDLQRLLTSFVSGGTCQVGLEAFMLTISFLYSGRLSATTIRCIDHECLHESCWPAVKFGIEMLCLSFTFDIPELKSLWQHHLCSMLEKAQVDEVLPVLVSAKAHGALSVFLHAKDLVAASNIDRVDLQKRLPLPIVEEVLLLRHEISTLHKQTEDPNSIIQRDGQRIWKALDSDDVELVLLLLNEGRVSLDNAYALHYAASYCDPHTVQDLLEVGRADINLRNYRGLTVLHVASMRKDPAILVSLLTKGANPSDVTSDGRTALQLCTRKISCSDYSSHVKKDGEELSNDRLAVEILDQAGRENPFASMVFAPIADEKEFFLRLLYLENRVAFAQLLCPQEAKLIMGLSRLQTTLEFTGLRSSDFTANQPKKAADVDLNEMPQTRTPPDEIEKAIPTPVINEALIKRVQALQKTVELAKRIFPRCISLVNSFMDDDLSELCCMQRGSPEEQKTKRQRYSDLKDMVAEAFWKDVAAMDSQKPERVGLPKAASSSSSSPSSPQD